jgi:hypothetical protein
MSERLLGFALFSSLGFLIFGLIAGIAAERAAGRGGKTRNQRMGAFLLGLLLGGLIGFGVFMLALVKFFS